MIDIGAQDFPGEVVNRLTLKKPRADSLIAGHIHQYDHLKRVYSSHNAAETREITVLVHGRHHCELLALEPGLGGVQLFCLFNS